MSWATATFWRTSGAATSRVTSWTSFLRSTTGSGPSSSHVVRLAPGPHRTLRQGTGHSCAAVRRTSVSRPTRSTAPTMKASPTTIRNCQQKRPWLGSVCNYGFGRRLGQLGVDVRADVAGRTQAVPASCGRVIGSNNVQGICLNSWSSTTATYHNRSISGSYGCYSCPPLGTAHVPSPRR